MVFPSPFQRFRNRSGFIKKKSKREREREREREFDVRCKNLVSFSFFPEGGKKRDAKYTISLYSATNTPKRLSFSRFDK